MDTDGSAAPLLLSGVRILDLTRNIAGPVATMLAAEMGADVVKVEPPGGDEMRRWPPFVDGESVYFVSCNRGKRSIALDLKADGDRSILLDLMSRADVVVENYRPGTLEKLGLGWDDLKGSHPKLVWISVTGYGRDGPRAKAPAYDSMIQAYAGIMHITGEADRGPVRAADPRSTSRRPIWRGEPSSGIHSVSQTEKGFSRSVADGVGAGFHACLPAGRLVEESIRDGWAQTMGMYPMGAFLAEDGEHCLIQVSNEIQWRKLCAVLGADELLADPHFLTNPDRVRNRDRLRPVLLKYLLTRTAKEWEEAHRRRRPASHVRGMRTSSVTARSRHAE
jgi:crotonobetainyl-CoA:carnitine CoA-transferase CaiB-like acyl-CoA transferase